MKSRKIGIFVKIDPKLRDRCKEYGINVSDVTRKALERAVIFMAGEKALADAASLRIQGSRFKNR